MGRLDGILTSAEHSPLLDRGRLVAVAGGDHRHPGLPEIIGDGWVGTKMCGAVTTLQRPDQRAEVSVTADRAVILLSN